MIGKKKTEQAPAPSPKKAATGPPAYLVKFENAPDMMGITKAVNFVHGHGVLDRAAIGAASTGYLEGEKGMTADGLIVLQSLAEFWKRQGAQVETVSQEVADAYRRKLESNPKAHLPKAKPIAVEPKEEAKTKAKLGDTLAPPHKRPKSKE